MGVTRCEREPGSLSTLSAGLHPVTVRYLLHGTTRPTGACTIGEKEGGLVVNTEETCKCQEKS